MSANHRLRWSSPLVRVGVVSGSLLVLGLILMGQSASRAETTTLSPQAVAVVPNKDKLQVTVDLAHLKTKDLPGTVQIELRDAKGKVVARAKAVAQKDRRKNFRCEIPNDKLALRQLKLVCRFTGKTFTIPVRRVLLARAHETALTASSEVFAGSSAALRCAVYSVKSITDTIPLAGARVNVTMRSEDGKGKVHKLFRGKTGKDGVVAAQFQVPQLPAGSYLLEVATRSALGEERLNRKVQVKADAKILLVSDKPLYQPGQTMHIRALALRPFDLKPVANTDLVFEVEDAKGNKVFKRPDKTSAYGIATVNFELADEVNMGNYTVRAIMGQQQAMKTVAVKHYVLPKFKVNLTTDRTFYLPKETVKAELQTDYFFGKPVANSKIKVTASTFDVAFRSFHTWDGTTDANGHAKFEIKLPDYFVGQPLQKGNALVRLEVKVTDTADHTETINRTYPVSDKAIQVSLIPEGGRLVPGMENRVYAAAIYPDGNPASCTIEFWMGKEAKGKALRKVKTNAAGLAEFTIKPKTEQFRTAPQWEMQTVEMLGGVTPQIWGPKIVMDLTLQARDAKGDITKTVAEVNSQPFGDNVLLRLNKAIYKAGDTLEADIRTSAGLPTVYLDIIKNGQTLLTRWLDVKDGKAQHDLDLPQNVFGTLEVHAYQMLRGGEIIRDSRVVYVHPRNDLKIAVTTDKNIHKPGENGTIHFQVTDAAGKPTAAALGVIIVDEAVYALQEMQPGLEKVYFTLQEELLKPQVQMAFRPNENINNLILQPALPAGKQQIAQVLLTAVRPKAPARWEVAPVLQRQQQLEGQIQQIGWALYNFASSQQNYLEFDKENKTWRFRGGLLSDAVKARQLNEASLTDPLGGKLTLKKLAKLEKSFTADRLAHAINDVRMHQLGWAFVQKTAVSQNAWLKDGKWTFPKTVLADAAKHHGGNDKWLTDVWGKPYRLVHLKKKQDHQTPYSQLDYYQLVSAGPDGKFGTKDDVIWVKPDHNIWQHSQWWWTRASTRLAKNQVNRHWGLRGFGRRQLMLQQNFALGAMKDGPVPLMATGFDDNAKFKKMDGAEAKGNKPGGAAGGAGQPVRVREYFPETLKWEPAIITDAKGYAALRVAFADSITTWRLSASASSRAGALGGVTAPLRVFQDFFVDIDLPVSLTQNDEVAFPVAVYNYLKTPQTVKLELQKEPWFELTDPGGFTRSLDLKANEITAVKFRIKANRIGSQLLLVRAIGSKVSDAIKRTIEVVPDGKRIEQVITDRLTGKVVQTIDIPPHALADASKLMVKIYPGVMSQVLEGAEGMIRLPGG